jgi:hypothetical protein
MKISKQTPMNAMTILGVDKNGAETFLLVVKGTFDIPLDGSEPVLSAEQAPLIFADEYYGDAAKTSIKQAYDFSLAKPMCDVVVLGSAHAPGGKPVRDLVVGLQIANAIRKVIRVVGDRVWERTVGGQFVASDTQLLETMPLIYERAFGGTDTSHDNPKRHGAHRENLVGTGFHLNADPAQVLGKKLPNLEDPNRHIGAWGETTPTTCFSFISPAWLPRASYAGTYDEKWREERFPLLPDDFNDMYFQAAPADQIVAGLQGGEQVTLVNLSPQPRLSFPVPRIRMPAVFMYTGRPDENYELKLDTLIIEPDKLKLHLVWRIAVRCIGKPYALHEVVVGEMPAKWWRWRRSRKRYYTSIGEFVRAKAAR